MFLQFLPLDFLLLFLYVAGMFKATVIILSLVWASLLLISWSGAENPPSQVNAVAFEQHGF
ncbi:hypothetical protein A7E78_12285 [Syntrophotalea acetylenivorans]|uniref:Uncharacterized protein n=1 Tax=Syntrophotalea acetylenivorans TaxID=1842532 RepID=A0A1L3GRI5_9BACT|nr:hypothetical protein [Syntrophotalea acetylenivorans]APG28552.1 hypothetical protein A7E78_12285 [Syntrophotalea acetylenivorans]